MAQDGYTYQRSALEKWIGNCQKGALWADMSHTCVCLRMSVGVCVSVCGVRPTLYVCLSLCVYAGSLLVVFLLSDSPSFIHSYAEGQYPRSPMTNLPMAPWYVPSHTMKSIVGQYIAEKRQQRKQAAQEQKEKEKGPEEGLPPTPTSVVEAAN